MLAMMQTLVPQRMRATAIALVYFFANLVGMGLGPFAAGVLSDALHPTFGEESLRYALVALWPGFFFAGWLAWRASKTIIGDLKSVPADLDTDVQKHSGAIGKSVQARNGLP
jgi:MFS family permease